jgi:hypothetical protein
VQRNSNTLVLLVLGYKLTVTQKEVFEGIMGKVFLILLVNLQNIFVCVFREELVSLDELTASILVV